MRGKLRDKRTTPKHHIAKREVMERPRSNKRDLRTMGWLDQEVDDDDDDELDEEETSAEPPQKK